MELSLAVNASLVALSKYGVCVAPQHYHMLLIYLQRYIVPSPSEFRLQVALMSAVSIRQAPSLLKILFWKASLVLSKSYYS